MPTPEAGCKLYLIATRSRELESKTNAFRRPASCSLIALHSIDVSKISHHDFTINIDVFPKYFRIYTCKSLAEILLLQLTKPQNKTSAFCFTLPSDCYSSIIVDTDGNIHHVLFTMVHNSHHAKRWEDTLWIQTSSCEVLFVAKLTLTKETLEIIKALKTC